MLAALLGIAVLGGGLWLTVTGLTRESSSPAPWATDASWWPRPGEGLRPGAPDWDAPGTLGVLAGVMVGLLCWLVAQAPARRPRRLALPRPALQLSTRALTRAVRADAEAVPGVARAHVRLSGNARRGRSRLALAVLLEPGAGPATVLAGLSGEPLRAARTAAGTGQLALSVRFRVRGHRTRRTR
ncbi:hypothetical protein [Streptomyces sp. H27-C3]|uniref:hypothetical protein n=1 Tax=Streptomyces sp. H27-C3 TaxID=3046305 RepID=UPI0024BBD4C1|nr:hypothetical protein [Streptomyces sp. H27-C3]